MCKTLEGREIIPESRNASVHRTVLFWSHLKSGKFPGIQITSSGVHRANVCKVGVFMCGEKNLRDILIWTDIVMTLILGYIVKVLR